MPDLRIDGLTKTAFFSVLEDHDATFTNAGGWVGVASFGDFDAEYKAQREGAGVLDASMTHKWEFRGHDALAAAQRVNTNDILGLAPGQVRYGPMCDADGLLVDDGTVYKFSEERLWVMTNTEDLTDYLQEATDGLSVEIEFITPQLPHLFLQGPRSRELLSTLTDADLESLKYFRFLPEQVKVGDVPVWLSRTGVSGELGYELFTRPEHAESLWKVLVDQGHATPYGMDAIGVVRVESGVIITGVDYEKHALAPWEVALGHLVRADRDFWGRAAVAANKESSRNRLCTVTMDASPLPPAGATLTDLDGREVGKITSPVHSPLFGDIGLAVVERSLASAGSALLIGESHEAPVTVSDDHPIYDPEKRRPRA